MQALLDTLLASAQAEQQQLEAARQQLEADRAAFEQETAAVQAVFTDSDQVLLNVGGTCFTTTVSTLRSAPSPSLFAAMFSGRHAVVRGPDGAVFIDRDGRHFGDVLNYLRTQQLAYPHDGSDFKYLLELRAEAEYYGLLGLTRLLDRYPWGLTRVVRGLLRSTEDTWVYEDGPDEVVLTVDAPVQLLGVGLAGSDAGYTATLQVLQVAEDFSEEVASLGGAAQSFTKADGPVVRLMLADPVLLLPGRYYMLSVLVKGSESYCCEDCMESVVAGGVTLSFQCWESPNGTSESRGQFPELYIRAINSSS
ncbi:hypothetical protein OEZ86_001275 [Tetradesmus obliquus]|nr:hypothetical protein OEZ86_001275 [Tetradesmus obliquus]